MFQIFWSHPSSSFQWLENQMDWILVWLMVFFSIICLKIAVLKWKGITQAKESLFFTEAIGLPITSIQSVVFFKALLTQEWLAAFVTLWWGPGFVILAILVMWAKLTGHTLNWIPYRTVISWLCKLCYLVYIALGLAWGLPKLIFALSAWIASDQIEKSFASLDADRTRRSFHDFWIIRLLYPAFLFLPFFTALDDTLKFFGTLLFVTWTLGIGYVLSHRKLMSLPENPSLLRNMMYFRQK